MQKPRFETKTNDYVYRDAQHDKQASLLNQLPLPYTSVKKLISKRQSKEYVVGKVQGWIKWSGLPMLKSKPGRGTGSHRIRVYRTEVPRFHLRQKDPKGDISWI